MGFSKTGIPGVGIFNPIIFALCFSAAESVGILLPFLIIADLFAVGSYRRTAQWKYIWKALPMILLGILSAYFLIRVLQGDKTRFEAVMKLAIGIIVSGMLILGTFLKKRGQQSASDSAWELPPWVTLCCGFLTGFTTMLANAAGPIFTIYLLACRLPKKEFMGTRAMAFFMINWIKVPFMVERSLITTATLSLNLILAPVLALGAWVGVRTLNVFPEKYFVRTIQVLVLLASVKFCWDGIRVLIS
ncbi:MAG: sulfite exporter TauE/SafE family protein [Lentisphaerae bacterium]|nr:MAG: sulfite exporter TauE/SafE family protein [Lentisphaerota bacterium]